MKAQTPELVIIDNPLEIDELVSELVNADIVAYDCETTGVHKGAEVIGMSFCVSEERAYYFILAYWDKEAGILEYIPSATHAAKTLLGILLDKKVIGHNGLFDCMMAQDYFGVPLIQSLHTCTMIMAHLLDENRPVGLKPLGVSLFGGSADEEARVMKESVLANGGSVTKDRYEMYKADARLLAKYGAKDAWLTYRIFMELLPQLYEQGLDTFFYEESMPLLKGPTYELNTTGLKVDTKALTELKKTLEAECAEDKAFIYAEITPYIKTKYPGTTKKNTFNVGASQQLAWLMFDVMGLEFGTLTKSGKEAARTLGMNRLPYSLGDKKTFIGLCQAAVGEVSEPEATVNGKKVRAKKFKNFWAYTATDKSVLKAHAPRYKWIDRLLSYQKKTKLLSTYVEGLEQRIQYGVIRPSFLQHGTTSGRYSSRNPNFQNLPRDDKRIKGCIVSRPGKSFVGADYSQLEPRVFAYYSNDSRLLEAFESSDDFYSVIGMGVFDKNDCVPRKDGSPDAFGIKYKKLRDVAKVVALSSTYGSTAFKLAPTIGKSVQDTEQVIEDYFERFPGVREMMLESHRLAKTKGYVENLFGRRRRMPDAMKIDKIYGKKDHADLPYEARNILNLAVNHRIQSTGASICNRAMIKFYNDVRAAGIEDCRIVLQVHDEIVVECKDEDADNISILLQNAMETAVELPGVVLEAVPKVAKKLGDLK